jgi:hypothetical protein
MVETGDISSIWQIDLRIITTSKKIDGNYTKHGGNHMGG